MNARVSLLRARMAPAALAAAIALAFGLSAPAQAQYTYPGTASATTQTARAKPAPAEQIKRPTRSSAESAQDCPPGQGPCGAGTANSTGSRGGVNGEMKTGGPGYPAYRQANTVRPARATPVRSSYGQLMQPSEHSNPSMRGGEACPPGSNCAPHGPGQQTNAGGPAPSGAYGAPGSYGYAASPTSAHQTAAPVSRNATTSPVRASAEHGALNYGPSQTSNANFRNSVTGKTSGPNVNTTGQQTSFNGPNGKKVSMDGSQTITGPNGQKQTIGGGPDLNNIGGGYGHQKGSGIKQGMSYSADGNGSMSGTRTGSAPGMASGSGMNVNNGGTSGVRDQADGGNSKVGNYGSPKPDTKGAPDGGSSGSHWYSGLFDWGGSSKSDTGSKSHATPNGGPVDPNAGADGIDRKSGVKVMVDSPKKSKDTADMGPTAGPGEIVSGTGQVVHPGQKKGQDTGGGQTGDAGTTNSGGQNAQGQYIAPSGQDNVKKPKEVGTLKMDYNGKNGAIDPKQSGVNGGGG